MIASHPFTRILAGIATFGLVAGTAAAQCSSSGSATMASYDKNKKSSKTIVDVAASAGQFNTLIAAAKAAGLAEALAGDGPLTVFAPTDEAFAKLPDGTVANLLKPENKQQLAAILKYHVVAGKVKAADVVKRSGATTLQGQRIDFVAKDGKVKIDGAKVVKPDIMASNGVIHVIDAVILPASDNIVSTAKGAKVFNTLLAAAKAADLAETLAEQGPFTVFAPTDDAFAKLPAGTVESLLEPENRDKLATILKHHVVSGRVYSTDAVEAGEAKSLAAQSLNIKAKSGKVMVSGAQVIKADLDASNGVIHVVDTVILPKATPTASAGY